MRYAMALLAFMFGLWAAGSAAEAARIQVDLATQTMRVTSASGDYEWPISSARAGYVTPRGSYGACTSRQTSVPWAFRQ